MGFKHAMLQRSYELAASPGPQLAAVVAPQPPPQPAVQVTDFSISRILGGAASKDNHVKKPSAVLDLSKSSNQQQLAAAPAAAPVAPLPVVPTQLNLPPAQLINPPAAAAAAYATGGYSMLPPDFLAMASATKFYAQFFPHLLPAYAAAAAAAGLTTPPTSPYQQQQQKRYFAPYVINGQSPTSRPKSSAPGACTRPDCLECLDYYKQFGAGAGTGYKPSPLISPAASSVSSSSSSRPARDLIRGTSQIGTTNICLTTVTNLNLSSTTTTSATTMAMLPKLKAVTIGCNNNNNTSIAEEISYKCRICDKVFGCSETLQVSGVYKMKGLKDICFQIVGILKSLGETLTTV